MFKDREHFHPLPHWDKEESARFLSAALGVVFAALLAVCAVYLVLNIHDYYGCRLAARLSGAVSQRPARPRP
jgi:hypothetical protein